MLAVLIAIGCDNRTPPLPTSAPQSSISRNVDMPPRLAASAATKQMLNVGVASVVQSDSPNGRYRAVFEDDGDTGYFYALDSEKADNPIADALHIYDVQSVADKDRPSELQIVWSQDATKVALLINAFPHAVFNFEDGIGCCRSGFPPPADNSRSHEWDESQMAHFFSADGK
jgi:hypothetical protein